MNIFLREMRAYRKSLIIWSIGIILFIISGMSKYAGLSSSGQSMNELMEAMPKSLQAIMGTGALDLATPIGYFGVLYLYLLLMGTIHAVMLGATIIAKEERDKTSEFLFVKPISRTKIITAKLIAALINVIIFNGITTISSIFLVSYYSDEAGLIGDISKFMVGLFTLQLLFLVIGTAIAGISRKPKKAASISTGILLVTFMLSIVVDLKEGLDFVKYITPFKYFEAENMLYGEAFKPVFVILSISLMIVLTAMTFGFYKKKDLNV